VIPAVRKLVTETILCQCTIYVVRSTIGYHSNWATAEFLVHVGSPLYIQDCLCFRLHWHFKTIYDSSSLCGQFDLIAKRCLRTAFALSLSYNMPHATAAGMARITYANTTFIAMYQMEYRWPRRPPEHPHTSHSQTSMAEIFFFVAVVSSHFLNRLAWHLPNAASLTRTR